MASMTFIHIDASSLTGNEAIRKRLLLQSAARSHASRFSHQARKGREQQRRRHGAFAAEGRRLEPRQEDARSTCSSLPFQKASAEAAISIFVRDNQSKAAAQGETVSEGDTSGTLPTKAMTSRQFASSAIGDRHGLRVDPFIDIPQKEAAFAWHVIDYFALVVLPTQTMLDKVFNVRSTYNRYGLQLLVQGDMRYATVLAFYSGLHQLLHSGQKLPLEVLRYVQQAVSSHRVRLQKLSGKADELGIRVTGQLALLAEATEDRESFLMHKKAVSNVVASVGGLNNLPTPRVVHNTFLQWNLFWTLSDPSAPLFDYPRPTHIPYYPRHPFKPEFRSLVAQLPLGFQNLAKQGYLASDVLELLNRVPDTTIPLTYAHGSSDKKSQPESAMYTNYWEAMPCLHREDDIDGTPDLERLIVLGFILYCCRSFGSTPAPIVAYRAARKRLSVDIIHALHHEETWPDLCLWLWMNAIDSWQNPNHTLHREGRNLAKAMKQSFPSITSNQILQERLKFFYWNEGFGQRCARYWQFDLAAA